MSSEEVLRKQKAAFKEFLKLWPSDDLEDTAASIGAEVVIYGDGEDDSGYLALEFPSGLSYITYDDSTWCAFQDGNYIFSETEVLQEAELEDLKLKCLKLENALVRIQHKVDELETLAAGVDFETGAARAADGA